MRSFMDFRLIRCVTLALGVGAAVLLSNVDALGQSQTTYACVNAVNGNVRFVNGPSDWRINENFREYESGPGPEGLPGPACATGPRGEMGPPGPTSPTGPE